MLEHCLDPYGIIFQNSQERWQFFGVPDLKGHGASITNGRNSKRRRNLG